MCIVCACVCVCVCVCVDVCTCVSVCYVTTQCGGVLMCREAYNFTQLFQMLVLIPMVWSNRSTVCVDKLGQDVATVCVFAKQG